MEVAWRISRRSKRQLKVDLNCGHQSFVTGITTSMIRKGKWNMIYSWGIDLILKDYNYGRPSQSSNIFLTTRLNLFRNSKNQNGLIELIAIFSKTIALLTLKRLQERTRVTLPCPR
jgi:hypothetical protein